MAENSYSQEDRQKLVITEGVHDQALHLEALDKKLGDMREEMEDLGGQMQLLQARLLKIQGERDEVRAEFWTKIRSDYRPFFREMTEAGFQIVYSRPKDKDTGQELGVMIRAVNPQEEAIRQIFRNFDPNGRQNNNS